MLDKSFSNYITGYWSSTIGRKGNARKEYGAGNLNFHGDDIDTADGDRSIGLSVRPVRSQK